MGERKGQNKYYPPDYDPKVGGLNKFLGTHALRERAKKIHLGIIIIRFEMPYNIWCEGCKNHIGMGVRYNAEKTKVGMYYSTPVYQFRMKCHLCDNYIEIKTDPGNLDYMIVSGASRQENRWDPTENGQVVPDTKEVQRKLFDDPMYKLEHVAADLQKGSDSKPRLRNLYKRSLDLWEDNYAANFKLRAAFRKRKQDEKQLERPQLNITLLPELEQDVVMATMLSLQAKRTTAENEKERIAKLINESVLPVTATSSFSDHRREKVLNDRTYLKNLGIVKRRKVDSMTIGRSEPIVASGSAILEEYAEAESNTSSTVTISDRLHSESIQVSELTINRGDDNDDTKQQSQTSTSSNPSPKAVTTTKPLLIDYSSSSNDSDS